MPQQRFMIDGRWVTGEEAQAIRTARETAEEKSDEIKPLTKNQIMDELKTLNVEFKTSAKRDDLEVLLNETKAKLAEAESKKNENSDANTAE